MAMCNINSGDTTNKSKTVERTIAQFNPHYCLTSIMEKLVSINFNNEKLINYIQYFEKYDTEFNESIHSTVEPAIYNVFNYTKHNMENIVNKLYTIFKIENNTNTVKDKNSQYEKLAAEFNDLITSYEIGLSAMMISKGYLFSNTIDQLTPPSDNPNISYDTTSKIQINTIDHMFTNILYRLSCVLDSQLAINDIMFDISETTNHSTLKGIY
jgi:hypothetical protein